MRRAASTHSARKVDVSHSHKSALRHRPGERSGIRDSDEGVTETPFAEGAHDPIDADLRHRLISEAAYQLYAQRGYVGGHDLDDWLESEALVDHVTISSYGEQETGERASRPARAWLRSRRSKTP